ncbi:MAG TPA: hypothetical protein VKS21_12835 [Spirochaetota bacterium]|nr:hypothetical protein [Spirochaetota bacterium]
MKKKLLIITLLLCVPVYLSAGKYNPWEKAALSWATSRAFDLKPEDGLSGLKDFFIGIQYYYDSFSPDFFKRKMGREWRTLVREKKDTVSRFPFSQRIQANIVFSPVIAPLNFSLKGHIFKENRFGKYFPQLTIGFSAWWLPPFAGDIIKTQLKEANVNLRERPKGYGVSPFIMAAKSFQPNVKLLTGLKVGAGKATVEFAESSTNTNTSDPVDIILQGNDNKLTYQLTTFEIFGGASIQLKSERQVTCYISYNFLENHIYLKSELMGRVFGCGVILAPLNVVRFKPYIRIRITF